MLLIRFVLKERTLCKLIVSQSKAAKYILQSLNYECLAIPFDPLSVTCEALKWMIYESMLAVKQREAFSWDLGTIFFSKGGSSNAGILCLFCLLTKLIFAFALPLSADHFSFSEKVNIVSITHEDGCIIF